MLKPLIVTSTLLIFGAAPLAAQEAHPLPDMPLMQEMLKEPTPDAPEIIPHGRVAKGMGISAWFTEPTDRYGHGVLGDAIEAGALAVKANGRIYSHRLGEDYVFEDLEPRIVDIDIDGTPEIITILTKQGEGAGVALYGIRDGILDELARSEFIGTSNRWLNPAGVGDFDNDGTIEIAYVETPHIGGKLVLLTWDKIEGRLVEERRADGYSTHVVGSTALAMSAVLDWDGDGAADLLLPRQNRRDLAVVSLRHINFRQLARIQHPAEIVTALRQTSLDGMRAYVYGLANGEVWALFPPQ